MSSEFTLVTALLDLHRGEWKDYGRSWDRYLEYLSFHLKLEVCLYLFLPEELIPWARERRRGREKITFYHPLRLEDLCMYQHREKITEIMASSEYRKNLRDSKCPEVTQPLYNVMVNSKVDLVYQASRINPFHSDLFVWFDAGYGHGSITVSEGQSWFPHRLFPLERKIHLITLCDLEKIAREMRRFFEDHLDVIIGGFFAGTRESLRIYRRLYYSLVLEALEQGITDDDQFHHAIAWTRWPELFTVHRGHWFDGYYLIGQKSKENGT